MIVSYLFLYHATKPSPLSTASYTELVPVVGYAALISLALTLVGLPIALTGDALLRRWTARIHPNPGTLIVTCALYFVGVTLFLDNLLYSLLGWGLRTDDGIPLKLALSILALATSLLVARRTLEMSARSARVLVTGMVALLVPALAVAAHYLATDADAPNLSAAGEASPNLSNVVILSSDGIDAERLSAYGYSRKTTPFLDSKVREFHRFDNAFTNNGNTTGSITSLLSGVSPLSNGVVYPPDALSETDARRTLPYLLGELGYHRSNWAVPHYADAHDQNLVGAFDLNNGARTGDSTLEALPLGSGPVRWFVVETLGGTTRVVMDVLGVKEMDNPYSQVSTVTGDTLSDHDRLEGIVHEIRELPRFFINTHFMGSHGPTLNVQRPKFSRGQEQTDPWERDFYDDAVLQFDSYVERVYQELVDAGKLDDTLIIVTSDHGIDYDASKRVPLLIRYPHGDMAGRTTSNVQRMDVAPTVLAFLGYQQPGWMAGQSLIDVDRLPKDRQILATSAATRTFSNHIGFRTGKDDLVVTAIRCGSYARRLPSGIVERGPVIGSTATCTAEPDLS